MVKWCGTCEREQAQMVSGLAGKACQRDELSGLTSAIMAGTIPAGSAAFFWGVPPVYVHLDVAHAKRRRSEMSRTSKAGLDF
jgi:hypothetical protein